MRGANVVIYFHISTPKVLEPIFALLCRMCDAKNVRERINNRKDGLGISV